MNKSVGLFAQVKGDPQVDRLIVWDYHVFLIHELSSKYMVYDFDSVLPFPCSFTHYFTHGLRWNSCLPEKLHRYYRVIPHVDYLNYFSSDRSHMQREDGSWLSPPPPYDCIFGRNAASPNTLPFYLDMTINTNAENSFSSSGVYGSVLTESSFLKKFSGD
nr:unnamed protein product [Trichobilharzia regenti]